MVRLVVTSLRRRVGMVFQRPNPFPKSIADNIAYGLRINGMASHKEMPDKVEQSLRRPALWDEVKDKLHECPAKGPETGLSASAVDGGRKPCQPASRALGRGLDADGGDLALAGLPPARLGILALAPVGVFLGIEAIPRTDGLPAMLLGWPAPMGGPRIRGGWVRGSRTDFYVPQMWPRGLAAQVAASKRRPAHGCAQGVAQKGECMSGHGHPQERSVSGDSLRKMLHFIAIDLGIEDAYSAVNPVFLTREIRKRIAVMPELLTSLRNCVDGLGCQPGYVNSLALTRAQSAIAKAEGRS